MYTGCCCCCCCLLVEMFIYPPSLQGRAAETLSRTLADSCWLLLTPKASAGPPPSRFFNFVVDFFADQSYIKNQTSPKTSKTQSPERPKLDFGIILGSLLPLVFDVFSRNTEISYLATSIKRNTCFSISKPSILASTTSPTIMFFPDTFSDTLH